MTIKFNNLKIKKRYYNFRFSFFMISSQSSFFFTQKTKKLIKLGILFEIIPYFKYYKIEKRYKTDKYILNQIQNKTLFIKKALYFNNKLLFMFGNVIIYIKNIL